MGIMVKILNYTREASRSVTEIILLKRAHSSNWPALCVQIMEFVCVLHMYVYNENLHLIREFARRSVVLLFVGCQKPQNSGLTVR